MNDITALAQRLAALMQEDCVPMSDSWGRLFDALQAGDTENERMARDLISRNGEIEGLRKRVEELEEVATDYGMKFQRAQDDLKKMALMHRDESRTVTVKRVGADQMHRVCLEATRHLDKYAAMAREVNKLLGSAATNTTPAQPVTVKLPRLHVSEVMLVSGFSRDYAEGWCAGNDNARHEIRAAGIQVIEGEQNNG